MPEFFGIGYYQLKRGDGSSGFPFKPETTVIPAGGQSETMAINIAENFDLAVKFTSGATGSVEIRRSDSFAFTDYEVLATLIVPASGTISSFSYPGNSASNFLVLANNTNQNISGKIQENVSVC